MPNVDNETDYCVCIPKRSNMTLDPSPSPSLSELILGGTSSNDSKNHKPIICGIDPDGSGGGCGYVTVSSVIRVASETHQTLLDEQKLWTLRAEWQSPEDQEILAERISKISKFIEDLRKC